MTTKVKQGNFNEIGFSSEDIDIDKAERAYSHLYSNPRAIAELERDNYLKFMTSLREEAEKYLPVGNEHILFDELERIRSQYLSFFDKKLNAASGTTSAFIAGASNFNHKQASRRGNTYDLVNRDFIEFQKNAIKSVNKATGADAVIKQQENAKKQKQKQSEKKPESNKIPIANNPNCPFENAYPLTKEEWKKISQKGLSITDDKKYRYRMAIINGIYRPIYIVDAKLIPSTN